MLPYGARPQTNIGIWLVGRPGLEPGTLGLGVRVASSECIRQESRRVSWLPVGVAGDGDNGRGRISGRMDGLTPLATYVVMLAAPPSRGEQFVGPGSDALLFGRGDGDPRPPHHAHTGIGMGQPLDEQT
jgi:hypothetical protein